MPRSHRKLHKDLTQLRQDYHDYLTNGEDSLSMDSNLKLINEISRIDRWIKEIEKMTMIELEAPVTEWDFQENSLMNYDTKEL